MNKSKYGSDSLTIFFTEFQMNRLRRGRATYNRQHGTEINDFQFVKLALEPYLASLLDPETWYDSDARYNHDAECPKCGESSFACMQCGYVLGSTPNDESVSS